MRGHTQFASAREPLLTARFWNVLRTSTSPETLASPRKRTTRVTLCSRLPNFAKRMERGRLLALSSFRAYPHERSRTVTNGHERSRTLRSKVRTSKEEGSGTFHVRQVLWRRPELRKGKGTRSLIAASVVPVIR